MDLASPAKVEDYRAGGEVPVGQRFCMEWEFNDTPDAAACTSTARRGLN